VARYRVSIHFGVICGSLNGKQVKRTMRPWNAIVLACGLCIVCIGPDSQAQIGIATPKLTFTNAVITCHTQDDLKTPAGMINGYTGTCGFGTMPAGATQVSMENYNSALLDANVPGTWYVVKISPQAGWKLSPAGTADHFLCWRRYATEYSR